MLATTTPATRPSSPSPGHDTASAFAAAPVRDEHAAVLSSGTWSLLGLELDAPVLDDDARDANLTNERGVDGTTRLLRNVMGLWLVQECARVWDVGVRRSCTGSPAAAPADVPLFDPDDDDLLAPGRHARADRRRLRARPASPRPRAAARSSRAILVSLACKYRLVLERLEPVTGARGRPAST